MLGQLELGDVHAGGYHDRVRGDPRTVLEQHARDALPGHGQPLHAAAAPLAREGTRERGDQLARVDRVVAVDPQREPDRRRERGLDLARLRRAQPLDLQAELGPEGGETVERLGLVTVAGDDQRSRAAIARLLEFVAEGRVAPRALQAQLQQSRSPNSASETGASMPAATCHAGGWADIPGSITTTRAPRCEARHAQASPIAPPPTTATSKLSDCADTAATASLRRHDPDQVRRSAPRWRPLSPTAGSRVRPHMVSPGG